MIRMGWALEQLEATSGVKGRMAKVVWWTEEMHFPLGGNRVNDHYPAIAMDYMGGQDPKTRWITSWYHHPLRSSKSTSSSAWTNWCDSKEPESCRRT
ncbi:unnamed protein product [Ectocarpus sp. 4 AP-2014]